MKGWTRILTFSMEKQIFSTNLETNCWHFSSFTPLMCVGKKIINICNSVDLKGGEQEESSPARGQPGHAEQRPSHSPGVLTVWWLLLMREQQQWWARWDSQSPSECRRCQKSHSSRISHHLPPAYGSAVKWSLTPLCAPMETAQTGSKCCKYGLPWCYFFVPSRYFQWCKREHRGYLGYFWYLQQAGWEFVWLGNCRQNKIAAQKPNSN